MNSEAVCMGSLMYLKHVVRSEDFIFSVLDNLKEYVDTMIWGCFLKP